MAKLKLPVVLHDRLLVTTEKPERKSSGGIIIPDGAEEMQTEGIVLGIGPKVGKDSKVFPKIGDRIKFGNHAGIEIEHDGKKYLVMRESDVYAIV